MARRATGAVVEHEGKDGLTYYALRFRAYGKRRYLSLGPVTRTQAERALAHTLADVERGIWQPAQEPEPPSEPEPDLTFHQYAEQWWLEHQGEWSPNTLADYRWRLEQHLIPFFGEHELSAITIAEVDRYKAAKLAEAEQLKRARAEALARGEKHAGPRGLTAASVNKTLMTLSSILETAEERELIARNPAAGKRRRVRVRRPRRTWLDTASQIAALLDAADELDAEAREDRQAVARRATLTTLAFSGLRIGELLDLRWRDVDLAAGRLRVGQAKTEAGQRDVTLLPVLREDLATLKASGRDTHPAAYVFGTLAGGKQSPSNVRSRVLAKAVERANENLAREEKNPLPEHLTPHSLRRTFASILYAIGRQPPEVMAEMGHTDPGLALRIYAHVMRLDSGEKDRLKALVEGRDWADMGRRADDRAADAEPIEGPVNDETRSESGPAADGRGRFRTSDLSRVKRALSH
jgi:integrase